MRQIRRSVIVLCSGFALCVAVALVAWAVAASPAPSPESPPPAVERKYVEGEPLDWTKVPPKVPPVGAESRNLDNAAVKAAVERWERAASRMPNKPWFHQPWYVLQKRSMPAPVAAQWWSTFPERTTIDGEFPRAEPTGGAKESFVRIQCALRDHGKPRSSAALTAQSRQAYGTPGWQATLHASMNELGSSAIVTFIPRGGGDQPLRIGLPTIASWWNVFEFNKVSYNYQVNVGPAIFTNKPEEGQYVRETLLQWAESPDSLRDSALTLLDELAAAVQAQVSSGAALFEATIEVPGKSERGMPPIDRSQRTDARPTADEIKEVLRVANAEIEIRRAGIKKHYKELHAALVEIFPMEQIFGEEQD